MGNAVENFTPQQDIGQLKNNISGSLQLSNGRLVADTGTGTTPVTIVGTQPFDRSVRANPQDELTRAQSHPSATGDLYVQNGNLYLTNDSGQVTLVG